MIGSILTNKSSKSVTIRGVEVPINWDFRTSIKFTELLADHDLSKIELIKRACVFTMEHGQIHIALQKENLKKLSKR